MIFNRFNSENGKSRPRARSEAIFIERSIREITPTTLGLTLIECHLYLSACFEDDDEHENEDDL